MALRTATVSPATPSKIPPPPSPNPPTGTWRHPRLREIEQRREAAVFTWSKLLAAMLCTLALLSTFLPLAGQLTLLIPTSITSLVLPVIRALLALGIGRSLKPIWSPKDEMSDIPLTPTQRSLLGLTPSSLPATPGSNYATPPRVARSTPRSDSSRAAVVGSSPQLNSGSSQISASPLAGRGGNTLYSPGSGKESLLVRKAMEGRRSSASGLGLFSTFDESRGGSQPATPGSGKSASVTLGSKWLYQRKKSRSSMGGLYT